MPSRGLVGQTWTCHICHDERPDGKISVKRTDISEEYDMRPGTIHENVRYCNDRPLCISKSKTFRLFKKEDNNG